MPLRRKKIDRTRHEYNCKNCGRLNYSYSPLAKYCNELCRQRKCRKGRPWYWRAYELKRKMKKERERDQV